MYGRLIITTIIGLVSSRYVLLALGASDFGLYAVVGGLISMLNVLSTAMSTTTRRFINVEMGMEDGNLNRIFNISRLLHIGFAIFIFLIAETIGLFYIHNYMNVASDKLNDALFVFQFSTAAAAISILNVPYQALMAAHEKFAQIAIFDIIGVSIKLVFVISLIYYEGNVLRFYAVGMSVITVVSLTLYNIACYKQWPIVVKYKFYRGRNQYKEILFFNNYVAIGSASYIARNQGSTLLVNFFFGTVVNAAFAIAYTIENYCVLFVNNIGAAAAPQVTKNYAGNTGRSVFLTETFNRFSIYLILIIIVPLIMELEFVLKIWLKNVPEGTSLLCFATLISALVRTFTGGTTDLVQASGKIKWFQIVSGILELLCIPVSYILFKMGYPSFVIIVVFIISSIVNRVVTFVMMNRILSFDVSSYAKHVYLRPLIIISILTIFIILYRQLSIKSTFFHISGLIIGFLATIALIYFFGFNNNERASLKKIILKK